MINTVGAMDNVMGYSYFGARYYDSDLSVWLSVDPKSDDYPHQSPFAYCSNNPVIRFDPNGMTDFVLDKNTGEVSQVGDANDKPDRILQTNRKGEVKYDKDGNAKVAINNIEQGILEDGQNFKTDDHVFEVGGEGQPSVEGVESFALDLSEYVDKEIGGTYYTAEGAENTTHISIGRYNDNTSSMVRNGFGQIKAFREAGLRPENQSGFFHTHPDDVGYSYFDRIHASGADKTFRDDALKIDPNLKFYILTRPYGYSSGYEKIDFTKQK
jgi:RHS repeat-associated protein